MPVMEKTERELESFSRKKASKFGEKSKNLSNQLLIINPL